MTHLSDEDFVVMEAWAVQAQGGDAVAYEALLQRLYPFVAAVIRARLGPVADVDDVTQECVLAVHKSLATYHASRRFKPWLMAIVRYKLADHFRARGRKHAPILMEDMSAVTADLVAANTDGEESRHGLEPVNLGLLLAALPETLRRAVSLTKLQGLSTSEAACREGISEVALRQRVSRAYREMARLGAKTQESERGD